MSVKFQPKQIEPHFSMGNCARLSSCFLKNIRWKEAEVNFVRDFMKDIVEKAVRFPVRWGTGVLTGNRRFVCGLTRVCYLVRNAHKC